MMMRAEFFEAFDFNRMLVVSVFVHLFFLTLVMFLPKPVFQPKKIIPAFMVNLIELPSSKDSRPKKGSPVSKKKIVATKPKPVTKESKATKALIHQLNQLSNKTNKAEKAPSNPLLRELNQLALLPLPVPKKIVAGKKNQARDKALKELRELKKKKTDLRPPSKSRKLKKPSGVVATLDELKRQSDALKKKKILPDKFELPKTIIAEDLLEEGEDLKIQDEPEKEVPGKKKPSYEKMKLAELPRATLEEKKIRERTAENILAELEAMSGNTAKLEQPSSPPEVKPPEVPLDNQGEVFQPILQKLASLIQPGKSLEIEVAKPRQKKISSIIRKQTSSRKISSEISQGEPGQITGNGTGTSAPKGEKDSTDILSLYVGTIQKIIFAHWKSPLGAEYNDVVEVSFYLYPKGNIDKPAVVKNSREEQLDTLAVRAIYDSEPFPKFPVELKDSNLHIKIKFKYTPADE